MSFRKIQTSNLNSTETTFDDPLIIINNNGMADTSDVGFLAKTASNTYTGLFRDGETKEYYLVDQYAVAITNNDVNPANVVLGDLNLEKVITNELQVGNITSTGYIKAPSEFIIDPAGHDDETGKVIIRGDLQVNGTTTTVNYVNVENVAAETVVATTTMVAPSGTLAQRPQFPVAGQIWFNTDTKLFEGFDGTRWIIMIPATDVINE